MAAAAAANPGHWDEAEDKCSGGPRTPIGDLSARVWVGRMGGAGSGDMEASGRPAIRDIFPCAPGRRPVAFVDVFVSCVGGGCAFLPAEGAVVSVPQTARESQAVKSVLLGRRPPPCRRSEICLCARVLPGAGGLRQQIARLDTGGAVVSGMGVYGYRALFLWFGCEAGSLEITSRGE